MSKFIVKIGDDTHQVERDAIEVPDGHVLMTQEQFNSTVDSKYAKAKKENEELEKAIKGQLKDDDDFFRQLAEKRGLQLDDDLKPQSRLDPEKVRQLKEQWKEEELSPVLEERDTLKKETDAMRRSNLEAAIIASASEMHPQDRVLKNPLNTGPSAFVRDIADMAEWDEEAKTHFFVDPKTKVPYRKDDGTYAGPEKVLERIRKDDADNVYFKDVRPGSSGYEGPGAGDTKKLTREQFDAMPEPKRREYALNGGVVTD